MSKVVQLIFGIAGVLLFAVLVAPAVAGYGYVLVMLPAYDQSDSCKGAKADPIQEDDYRVYLLNRGCNLQKAMEDLGREFQIEPGRLMAFYRGQDKPSNTEEWVHWDSVQSSLKTFKSFSGPVQCPPDCGLSGFWGRDPISRMFDAGFQKYFEIAIPIFLGAIGMGASHVASIMQKGPLAQGLLYMAYVVGLAIAASALYDLLKQAFK